MRDLTQAQFRAACCKRGFKLQAFLGYVELAPPVEGVCVSRFNAGTRLRDQLTYLITQQAEREARAKREG